LSRGAAQLRAGRYAEAAATYETILARQPEHIGALHFLARAIYLQGDTEAALQYLDRALQISPENPYLYNSRGILLNSLKKRAEALLAFEQAAQRKVDYFEPRYNLALVACELGRFAVGIQHFQEAMALKPGGVGRYCQFGEMLCRRQQFEQAATCFRAAIDIDRQCSGAYNGLALALRSMGSLDEAAVCYRQALKLKPDYAVAHSALLSMLAYHVMCSPEALLREHRAWDRIHGGREKALSFVHQRPTEEKKRLRIGYVSPDFYRHAVSQFIRPVLENHDREQVEVYCYAEVHHPDEVTTCLQQQADVWRSTVGLSDEQVAQMIHADGIDVLVDLAGHSHADRTRLKALTWKPAPVQAAYLGYFATTGLAAMDYWISDTVTHPEDTVEQAVETIYRLPRCCVSYQPPREAPAVVARQDSDCLTFGCFNNITKVGDEAIICWSRILQAVPDARLVLKAGQFADPAVRRSTLERFAHCGVAPERLQLWSYTTSLAAHFALYGEIDIALDTLPRTGVTTTADALWMGVPVVTLAGGRFIERLGASLLTAIGLEALIAFNQEDYIAIAVALAQDPARRRQLRANLRERLAASPLCDGRDLTRHLEAAYRRMWRQWWSDDPGRAGK